MDLAIIGTSNAGLRRYRQKTPHGRANAQSRWFFLRA